MEPAASKEERALLWRILGLGALSLYLEIFLVRWVGSEVRLASYFRGLVLIGSFLGLGLGYRLQRVQKGLWPALAAVAAIAGLSHPDLEVGGFAPRAVLKTLAAEEMVNWQSTMAVTGFQWWLALFFTVVFFLLIAGALLPFGAALGRAFSLAPHRGRAYLADLLGSLTGVVGFALLSVTEVTPAVWLLVAAAGVALADRKVFHHLVLALLMATVGMVWIIRLPPGVTEAIFSPYQSLELRTDVWSSAAGGKLPAQSLSVNGQFYQALFDERPETIAPFLGPGWKTLLDSDAYNHIYTGLQGKVGHVLILGAGTGNDAAAALRGGATHVDAVELDPVIARLGAEMHPEHPYADPRVTLHVTDARGFIMRSKELYDVVVFGLLDSHSLSGTRGNTSLDSLVYTQEGLKAAMARVAPGGVLVLTFQMVQAWMCARLFHMLEEASGQVPRVVVNRMPAAGGGAFVVNGWGVALLVGNVARYDQGIAARPDITAEMAWRPKVEAQCKEPQSATSDDWPYIYLKDRGLPVLWPLLSAVVGLVSLLAFFLVRRQGSGGDPSFFFLGAAFLFVEMHTVSRAGLLFGNTWVVSAVAVGGVLAAVGAGNLLALRLRVDVRVAAALLLGGLVVNSLLPSDALLVEPMALRAVLAALVLGWPLAAASMIFIRCFEATRFPDGALSVNLLGAVAGGLLEAVTYVGGLQMAAWCAVALYCLALATMREPVLKALRAGGA